MDVTMKKYVVKLNDRVYEVEMGEVPNGATVLTAAPAASNNMSAAPTNAAPAPSAGAGHVVIAPMPGSIVDVKVKVGDVVKRGQVLLVLEAMKMENEIVSPVDGTILSVNVTKGSMVNVSEEFLRIG